MQNATRADSTRTIQFLKTTEVRTMRLIVGKKINNGIRNDDIQTKCDVTPITEFVRK